MQGCNLIYAMTYNLENNLLKVRIIAWIIFAIPVIIFVFFSAQFLIFLNSAEWQVMLQSGQNTHKIMYVIIIGGVSFFSVIGVVFWFCGHYFVERAKNKMYKQELERLRKRTEEQYPERLEDLP